MHHKNNIPKVRVEITELDEYFDTIHHFLNPSKGDWDWRKYIFMAYPDLKNKLKVNSIQKKRKIEYDYFKEKAVKESKGIKRRKNKCQKEWNKINDRIMLALSDITEQPWPRGAIHARITLNPICPRYIKTRTFDFFYRASLPWFKSITIHELLHFIYFNKWKRVFPKTKEKEFEGPHLIWHLSEMVTPILLNDRRIQKIFRYKFESYEEYKKISINGKNIIKILQDYYDNRENFEDFLKKSYKFVKNHENKIKSV